MENSSPNNRSTSSNQLQSSKSTSQKHIQGLVNKRPQEKLLNLQEFMMTLSAVEAILKALLLQDHQGATMITNQLQTQILKPELRQVIQKMSHDKQALAKLQRQQADSQDLAIKLEELQRGKRDIENQYQSMQLILNEQIQNLQEEKENLSEKLRKQEALKKPKPQQDHQSFYDEKQKVDLLKKESFQIQARIESMKREQAKLEVAQIEFLCLNQRVESLRREQIKLAEKQKALSQNDSLRKSLGSKQKELEEKLGQLKQKQKILSDLNVKLETYESLNNNQSLILNQILTNHVENRDSQQIARLKERNQQLQKELDNTRKKYEQCLSKNDLLEDSNKKMATNFKKLRQEAEKSSQTQARNFECTVSRLRDEHDRESMTIAKIRNEAEEVQQQMRGQIEDLQHERASLMEKCESLQKAKSEEVERQRNFSKEQIKELNRALNEEKRQHLERIKEHDNQRKLMRQIDISEVTYEEVVEYLKQFCTTLRGDNRRRFKGKLSEIARI